MNPEFINSQILAYLGDSVIELMARDYLIKESGLMKVNELYQRATHFVSAKAHTDFIHHCLDHSFLSEEEVSIYKRGRNTKNNKNETAEHRCSTGFEALIGYLYLKDDHERIKEIFQELINYVNGTNLKQI